MSQNSLRILIVEDDYLASEKIREICERLGYTVVGDAADGEEAVRMTVELQPDVVLMDIEMPRLDGLEAARRIQERRPTVIVVLTAHQSRDRVQKACQYGIGAYLVKPPEARKLERAVSIARARFEDLQTLRHLNSRLEAEIAERQQAQAQLQAYSGRLEELVEARTQSLRISEAQYRALAENLTVGLAIFQDEHFVFSNQAISSIFGYSPQQFKQIDPLDLVRADYTSRVRAQIEKEQAGEVDEHSWHVPCLTSDDREIWIEVQRSMLEWEQQAAILIVVRDITEQKQEELALQQEQGRLKQENIALRARMQDRYRFGPLIGKSRPMQHLYEQMVQAAASDASVCIFGETGVGKDLVARTIHGQSERGQQNFVSVNCGAITDTLFEREFFGHRKGVFTGAHRDTPGYLHAAHQGTLFLDEIGELTPAMQVKLLRALENREYTPLGDTTAKSVDVRIIAATNRTVEELQSPQIMRPDFFYRIHVIALTVPPLRDHAEDIPLLVEHFLKSLKRNHQRTQLPGRLMDRFMKYHWPGNIRELQNEIQRFLAGQPPQFLGGFGQESAPETSDVLPETAPDRYPTQLKEALDSFEKQMILHALDQNDWHRGATAAHLDIPTRTLQRKMKKYHLTRPYRKSSSSKS